jgi:penicillin-binding protein 1C
MGTSTDMRDNWCVGFSRRYTVGVWVGNFSGEPMRDVSGVTGAAPVWLEMMDWLHRATSSEAPAPPAGVVATTVSFLGDVEPARSEWALAGTEDPAPALASGAPRIRTPVTGSRFALDPDVPPERQRLPLDATGASGGNAVARRWPRRRGRGCRPPPGSQPGRHALELVDATGAVRDRVEFEVSGTVNANPGDVAS